MPMRPLSASQAVAPAFRLTKSFLFRPFDWATYLKLGAVACITENLLAGYNFAKKYSSPSPSGSWSLPHFTPHLLAWTIFIVLSGGGLAFLFYYVAIRLRFSFFHCLIHKSGDIGAACELYARPAWRLFVAHLLAWLAILGMALTVIGGIVVGWVLSTSATGFADMLEDAAGWGAILRAALEILFSGVGIGFTLLATLALCGPVATWIRSYAILFFASRYRNLGDLVESPANSLSGTAHIGAA
jgi:hypothetical protein